MRGVKWRATLSYLPVPRINVATRLPHILHNPSLISFGPLRHIERFGNETGWGPVEREVEAEPKKVRGLLRTKKIVKSKIRGQR